MVIDVGLGNDAIINNIEDCALQELDILFSTNNTELLGVAKYGINFEQFLWKLTPMVESLEKYIIEKIQTNTFYVRNLNFTVKADYVNSDSGNMYIVHMGLQISNKQINKDYYIS